MPRPRKGTATSGPKKPNPPSRSQYSCGGKK